MIKWVQSKQRPDLQAVASTPNAAVDFLAYVGAGADVYAAAQNDLGEHPELARVLANYPGKVAYIDWIMADDPGSGAGSKFLQRVLAQFDKKGVQTTLLLLSHAGGVQGNDVEKRTRFFSRHGFNVLHDVDYGKKRRAMERFKPDPRDNGKKTKEIVKIGDDNGVIEFPRDIAEQVRVLRPALWAKHGTGGNPPTRWTGDHAYDAWGWWITLRNGAQPAASEIPRAKDAYNRLTGETWTDSPADLFETVVNLWRTHKQPAFVSRHAKNFRPGAVISMIKWAAVNPRDEESSPGSGHLVMLDTLDLALDSHGKVVEKNLMRANAACFHVV